MTNGQTSLCSLIPSLIHPRAPTSIGVYRRSLSRQVHLSGRSCTVILNPEKRKVGSSILPWPLCLGMSQASSSAMISSHNDRHSRQIDTGPETLDRGLIASSLPFSAAMAARPAT